MLAIKVVEQKPPLKKRLDLHKAKVEAVSEKP
jgi:hypothetical protein